MTVELLDTHPPVESVIAYLEDLLERAKIGEIQTMAIAVIKSGCRTANGWAGVEKNCMALIGEVEVMKVDLIRANVDMHVEYIELQ